MPIYYVSRKDDVFASNRVISQIINKFTKKNGMTVEYNKRKDEEKKVLNFIV